MIKIFIYTTKDKISNWVERFIKDATFDDFEKKNMYISITKKETWIKTTMFEVTITCLLNEARRAQCADTVILDTYTTKHQENIADMMLAHRRSIVKTENWGEL